MMLKDRMTGDADMRAGHERLEQELSPVPEERPEVTLLLVCQHGEAGQRIALVSADVGGQAPNAATSVAQLGQFLL